MPAPPAPRRRVLGKSALVGVVATVVDLAALALLIEVFGVAPAWANLPALTLGLALQFFGNKYYAFDDRSRDFVRQGACFAVVEVGAFALNAAAFHLLAVVFALPFALARVLGAGVVYFGFSYPLWGRIFVHPDRRSTS